MGIPFDKKELEVMGKQMLRTINTKNEVSIYNYPTTPREAYRGMFNGRPVWISYLVETQYVMPYIIPDNVARGLASDIALTNEQKGGPDMFGIEWQFIPQVGGSMVRPGKPLLEDISQWREKVKFPDVDSWDWEGASKRWKERHDPNKAQMAMLHNGFWFERLISFMDFENAAIAMITEQEELNELFTATTDVACKIVDKFVEYFDLDSVNVHDDWGTMKSSFFSPACCAEVIVPHMRRFTDYCHSKGLICDLHSCGKIDNQIDNILAAGWDSWTPMSICDTSALYEKAGDKMILGVMPEIFDPATTTEEEQRQYARNFVDKFCHPGKIAKYSIYGIELLTPAFLEELYVYGRKRFAEFYD